MTRDDGAKGAHDDEGRLAADNALRDAKWTLSADRVLVF
jgi:hypothetical protein